MSATRLGSCQASNVHHPFVNHNFVQFRFYGIARLKRLKKQVPLVELMPGRLILVSLRKKISGK